MNYITRETRLESYLSLVGKRSKKHQEIIKFMYYIVTPITAKELSVMMFNQGLISSNERNETAPRLTELEAMNIVEVVEKAICKYTGKRVALYQLTANNISNTI